MFWKRKTKAVNSNIGQVPLMKNPPPPQKKVFVTIEFADTLGVFDYPKHLPIPHKEDVVHFDGKFGKVKVVKHMTEGTVTVIRIKCCRL